MHLRRRRNAIVRIEVECHAGYRGEETPRRLLVGKEPIEVVDVMDRWLAPDNRYFKCLGADGATYIVRNDERSGTWELTLYRVAGQEP